MGSVVEGVYTLKIDKVSELVKQDKANTELHGAGSYERMYYATYGPFTVGEFKCDFRVSPLFEELYFNICFIENAGALKKIGYVMVLQDHSANSDWIIHSSTRQNDERAFSISSAYINASGIPVFYYSVENRDLQKYSKDDSMVVKFVIWVLLDDSKVAPPKPVPQPDQKHDQPNYTPPGFVGKLLAGQFADIFFTVKEQIFPAHKAILAARSSVFQSELLALQDITCECKLRVSVQHMDALTFTYLLHFIYADSLPDDFEENTPPERYHLMFIAAHRFEIEALKLICEEKLTKAVTDTIAITLKLIDHQECGLLKIVPKDCGIKPEVITTTTSVTKIGDRLYGTSITE